MDWDSNNVLNSLIAMAAKFKFKLNIGCPKNYSPNKLIIKWAKNLNKKIFITNDPIKATKNADVIFADKVISLNDKVDKKKKLKEFKKFKITKSLLSSAKKKLYFSSLLTKRE